MNVRFFFCRKHAWLCLMMRLSVAAMVQCARHCMMYGEIHEYLWVSTDSSHMKSCTRMYAYHLNDLMHTEAYHLSCYMQLHLTTASDKCYCNCI